MIDGLSWQGHGFTGIILFVCFTGFPHNVCDLSYDIHIFLELYGACPGLLRDCKVFYSCLLCFFVPLLQCFNDLSWYVFVLYLYFDLARDLEIHTKSCFVKGATLRAKMASME